MRNPVFSFTASINGYYIRSTILSLLNGMLLRLEHEQVITIPFQSLGARSHSQRESRLSPAPRREVLVVAAAATPGGRPATAA